MPDYPHRLQYLAPARPTRLPMHSLVVGVLASAFQICFGGLLGYGVVRATYHWIVGGGYFNPLWSILFVPIAAVFFASGLRLMVFTVASLRGRQGNDAGTLVAVMTFQRRRNRSSRGGARGFEVLPNTEVHRPRRE